ncbi:MAG: CBS domain-containing protein [Anaerolineales bacterium]|jgi:acetoin utilization protein AcuB|nr:CBS domain-containing protein [Anaerolineales bacterium]|tara:strand:+ start:1429 stop:1806 length:378 start_codon:yes stop_codon:yes gene_type:complete
MPANESVRNWMTADPIAVSADTSLPEADKLMEEHNIRRLTVMKGDALVGIITRGDVRGADASDAISLSIWELTHLLNSLAMSEVMSRPVVSGEPEMTVGAAAWLTLGIYPRPTHYSKCRKRSRPL